MAYSSHLLLFTETADNKHEPTTFAKLMTEANFVDSGLPRRVTVEGGQFNIEICKLEHKAAWSLETVDDEGTSTVWDDLFDIDQAAGNKVLNANE